MTTAREEIALDWVEQWRDFCAGKPARVLKELDAPHGRVRIHGRRGDPHDYVATFVRNPDGMVFPLGTGDYSSCADACIGVLSGVDAVWDNDKFPPFSVIARRCRKFFSPVDGRTVVGALEIVGGVVLLGVHHKVWSLLFHDGQRSEWLRASSRTFDLDAWLRDRPGATVSAPVRQPPAEPAPASPSAGPAAATPPSPASPSAEPAVPPSPASPSAGSAVPPSPADSPGAPAVSTPPSATASTSPAASREPSPPAPAPVTPAERRRQALAAQRDAELREQQDEAARKDAALREQQRRVVLGPEPDPGEGPSDSDTVRACLMRLPDRAPTGQPQLVVEWFAKVVLAVGEAGYFGDLAGRKADIAATLSRVLGAPVCAKMLGLALTILHRMGTCLVALANKKWWTVKLSGLADRASSLHRDLLAETGIGFQLRPTRHAFRGRQPVRWEVPRHVAAGEVAPRDKPSPNTEEPTGGPRSSAAAETPTPAPAPSPGSAPSGPIPVDAATGAEDADLRHRLTVAHGLAKLAHQRHDTDRAAWQREKAELEQRVAVAEKQAHAAGAELARVREQYDELKGKLTAIQETAERTTGLVDKLERATAALVASAEQQESLARSAEVLTAERDQLAAEVERLTRLADEQDRRVRGQTAEPAAVSAAAVTAEHDQLAAEVALIVQRDEQDHQATESLLAAAAAAAVAHEQLVPDAPRNADGVRRAGPPSLPPTALACVALTLAGLAFRSSRRKPRVVCRPPSRFPRAPRASSTSDGGAQGPRGPPAW